MSLLSPASLAWLGLLIPLVILYILKRRRTRKVIGSTLLWEAALRDLRAERPWRRLIPHLSLFLQALIVILGALALARPAGAGHVPRGAEVCVVIDTSASMAALDADGDSRLARAQQAARSLAEGLPPGGRMMIVEAASEPAVLRPPSADLATLTAAIDGLAVRGGQADLEAAIALASERLRGAPAGSRILLLSDLAQSGELVLAGSGAPIEAQRITEGSGTEAGADNNASVALDVRANPSEESPDRAEIFVRMMRFGEGSAELWLSASLEFAGAEAEPRLVATRRVTLSPEAPSSVVLHADLPPDAQGRAGIVRVRIASDQEGGTADAFALDDAAVAPSPAARRLPVFLVGEEPGQVLRVLRADRDVELYQTTLEALGRRDEEAPPLEGLFFYVGATPGSPPAGDSVVIAPEGDAVFGVELGEQVEGVRPVTWEEGDPLLRFVSFANLHFGRVRTVRGAGARPLFTSDRGTLIAVQERPEGETTILAFDPAQSDWPRHPSFVIFFRNLLERARERRAAGGVEPGGLGEPLRIPLADGEEAQVVTPGGERLRALSRGGVAVLPIPAEPGAFAVTAGPRQLHALRNLLDPEESDLRPRARLVRGEGGAEVRAEERREHPEAWPWLVGALLLVLVGEALWASRKGAA